MQLPKYIILLEILDHNVGNMAASFNLTTSLAKAHMGASKNRGPQTRPQYSTILIIRTPKKGPKFLEAPIST